MTNTRTYNRALKGGTVSPVNGRFYRGGQFMPVAPVATVAKPAAWVVRPLASGRFVPVAKLADGIEVPVYRHGIESFDSVRAARLFIVMRWDGGRKFPSAPVARVTGVFGPEDSAISENAKGIRSW